MEWKVSKFCKPNFIDLIADLIICYFIGKRFGISIGFFAFAIATTLNQILWAICEQTRSTSPEKSK
jgi:hypothetical protein